MGIEQGESTPEEAAKEFSKIAFEAYRQSPDVGRVKMDKGKFDGYKGLHKEGTPYAEHLARKEDELRSADYSSEGLAQRAGEEADKIIQGDMKEYIKGTTGHRETVSDVAADEEMERIKRMQERAEEKREA